MQSSLILEPVHLHAVEVVVVLAKGPEGQQGLQHSQGWVADLPRHPSQLHHHLDHHHVELHHPLRITPSTAEDLQQDHHVVLSAPLRVSPSTAEVLQLDHPLRLSPSTAEDDRGLLLKLQGDQPEDVHHLLLEKCNKPP